MDVVNKIRFKCWDKIVNGRGSMVSVQSKKYISNLSPRYLRALMFSAVKFWNTMDTNHHKGHKLGQTEAVPFFCLNLITPLT